MHWINQYLRTNFRQLTLLEKAEERAEELKKRQEKLLKEREGNIKQKPDVPIVPEEPEPGTPHAALSYRNGEPPIHTSRFEELIQQHQAEEDDSDNDDVDPLDPTTTSKLLGQSGLTFRGRGGKIKRSNKKQHKKYKNTRKGRRRTNKNKKKRANKTNKKKKTNRVRRYV
jgi:hypothetical protein